MKKVEEKSVRKQKFFFNSLSKASLNKAKFLFLVKQLKKWWLYFNSLNMFFFYFVSLYVRV